MPRVKLFSHYEVFNDPKALLKRFYEDDFDYRNTLLLEKDPHIVITGEPGVESKADIVSYNPNKIVVSVSTDQPALLFLSDSYYPGWKVTVNNREEDISIADYTLRAVVVPSGKSRVVFSYTSLF